MRPRLPAWIVDWLPPVVIVLVGVGSAGVGPASRLLAVALAAPLPLRRRHPLGVFAAVSLVALAQLLSGDRHTFGDAAVLVALYTVAVTQPPVRLLAPAAVMETGIVLAATRWTDVHPLQFIIALNAMAIAATVIGVNLRNRRALLDSLRDRATRLELERDQQGQIAAAAERARIAREMHDIVAHNLSVMIALAEGATYAVSDAPERAAEAMQNAARSGREALTEMRRLLGVLRDDGSTTALRPQPDLGELEALVDRVRAAGLPVELRAEGVSWSALPPGLQLAAFRIVQEALTNTLKHAGPATAAVHLLARDGELRVEVTDTGAGGSVVPGTEGGGLRGMRERAAVYGGAVEAGPGPSGGWRVLTTLSAYAAAVS